MGEEVDDVEVVDPSLAGGLDLGLDGGSSDEGEGGGEGARVGSQRIFWNSTIMFSISFSD